ncbi:MAG: transglutaminase family protein [Cyanobacteria bacterium P01_C01_bin.69]
MNHYKISHTTRYTYSSAVELRPHTLRLCPRSDGAQWLKSFDLGYSSAPSREIYFLDPQGNTCVTITFEQPLNTLEIKSVSEVHTVRSNPFDYVSEPWATHFPVDYPVSLATQLSPYLDAAGGNAISSSVIDLAHNTSQAVSGNVGYFLMQLTQQIPDMCQYQQRLQGAPYAPGITLQKKSGTCRDYAVLFVALCRVCGLAARFVSGYQEGDLEKSAHDLHAWAEVYIPGGGWRGFDPTLGLAVGDRHIAIAAAASPQHAAPVSGTLKFTEETSTQLETDIRIELL